VPPTPSPRLDRIEVARGIAALLIVLYHATAIVQTPAYHGTVPWGGFFSRCGFGVDFFFVLSGFIIFHIHRRDIGKPEQAPAYVAKRLVRIYPPYWAALAFVVPIYFLRPGFGSGTETEPLRLFTSLLLLPHPEAPILPVAWSLRHEMLFYAVFGLLVWRRPIGIAAFVAWQAFVLVLALTGEHRHYLLQWLGDLRNFDFVLGIACALWVARTPPGPGNRTAALIAGGAGGALILGVVLGEFRHLVSLPYNLILLSFGIASAGILYGLAHLDLTATRRPPAFARLIGEASYSIYLIHYALLSAFAKAGRALGLNQAVSAETLFLILAVAATAGGIAFHRGLERPLLDYGRRRFVPPKASRPGTPE
jgi:exopolysaccharide production protein ExoZ